MPTNLVVGCYERFVFGFNVAADENEVDVQRAFNYPAHQAGVKCLALCSSHLASGGLDDQIHLYNIKDGKDLGFLVNPGTGAITSLAFIQGGALGAPSQGPSHMLSGSQDGSLMLWKAGGSWDALKHMKGHKGAINDIALHSSGVVALTVARDRQLRLWNLLTGKSAFQSKLATEAIAVSFSPSQPQTYALLAETGLTVHDMASEGATAASWQLPSKSQCFTWVPPQVVEGAVEGAASLLVVGSDNGNLSCYEIGNGDGPVWAITKAHNARIKAVAVVQSASADGSTTTLLASACSRGELKLWDLQHIGANARPIATADTGARITCLASVPPSVQHAPAVRPSVPQTPDGQIASHLKSKSTAKRAADGQTDAQVASHSTLKGAAKRAVKHAADGQMDGHMDRQIEGNVAKKQKQLQKHGKVDGNAHGKTDGRGKVEGNGKVPGNSGGKVSADQRLVQRSKKEGRNVLHVENLARKPQSKHGIQQQHGGQAARVGVAHDGVVEFADAMQPRKKQKKAVKKKEDERGMPTVEDAELAALKMGLEIDIAAQQEELLQHTEKQKEAKAAQRRGLPLVSQKVYAKRKARIQAAEAKGLGGPEGGPARDPARGPGEKGFGGKMRNGGKGDFGGKMRNGGNFNGKGNGNGKLGVKGNGLKLRQGGVQKTGNKGRR